MRRQLLGSSLMAITILGCVSRVSTTETGAVATATADPGTRIANAMSAAPPSIANAATIMD